MLLVTVALTHWNYCGQAGGVPVSAGARIKDSSIRGSWDAVLVAGEVWEAFIWEVL